MNSLARLTALTLCIGAGPAWADCAVIPGPCTVPMGDYHIALPDGDGPHPAILMLHGAGGRGEGMVNMLSDRATARGYAVIGPQGLQRPGSRFGSTWSFHPDFETVRDEAAFFEEVLSHAAETQNIDRDAILVAGFSIGGSMTSYLACDDPDIARAYAPVAGAFWRPHPALDACAAPVDVFHTHGWRDGTVPIEGRVFRDGAVRQGDVFASMEIWRETNGCARSAPDEITAEGDFWHRIWTSCDAGGSLQFALFPGGHAVPAGWVDLALDWFETLDG
ncbi:dienelactone hydrolase family protein [Gymnodinialimonas sp. 2305UL16-5]|uniref:alpha/beta hydrolase family esterase n=1 Tax=Gymnodinialimonas mytili TaxID=3126503 RepID=UPI00309839E6